MKDVLFMVEFCLESVRRIEENVSGGREAVSRSHPLQDAILRNLQLLAETTQRFPTEAKDVEPQFDWKGLAKFRNVLVHDYFFIDWEKIWEILEQDLPALKVVLQRIQRNYSGPTLS